MDYIIRGIPDDLHRQAKVQAAMEGITLKELILRAIKDHVDVWEGRKGER